jgi:predicted ATPase
MTDPNYQGCQELSRNEWFLLCRGLHREDDRPVFLKIRCPGPASSFALRLLKLARNIPYHALIQAFQQLVPRLLAEGEERPRVWRVRLPTALGINSGALAEVLPEIEGM